MLERLRYKTGGSTLNMHPSKSLSQYELRFGKRGSLSVDLKNNVWFDHAAC